MSTRLPHQPETIEAMQARYPRALERVFTRDEMRRLVNDSSWQWGRQNLFDFEDGLRLLVSVEHDDREPPPGLMLHVSASPEEGSKVWKRIEAGLYVDPRHFALYAARRFKELSGVELWGKCWFAPKSGIPHWFVPHKVKSPAAEVVAGK